MRKFSDVIDAYDRSKKSVVCWCRLKTEYRQKINNVLLFEIFNNYNGRMYALSFIDLFTCAFPKLRFLRKLRCRKPKWQFCSQLVANIFKELRILSDKVHTENVLPCDFLIDSSSSIPKTYDTDNEIPVLFDSYDTITIMSYPTSASVQNNSEIGSTSLPILFDIKNDISFMYESDI